MTRPPPPRAPAGLSSPTWTRWPPGSHLTAWPTPAGRGPMTWRRSCTPAAPPAPRRSPRTPTPTSSPAAGGSPCPAGWARGRRCWPGCRCSTSTRSSSRASRRCSAAPGWCGRARPATATRRFWKIIEHYKIVAMSAVPTVYGRLAQVPVDADISTLRVPIAGAAPLPASVAEAFAAHTGRQLLEGYGLTEATCATTWTRPGEERPGSVGRALPGQQIKAVRIGEDGSWADCAPGEAGLLMIGGPAVFAGYLTDPRRGGPRVSREGVVRDGWLDTGDLGMVDAGGFVYLTGRAKDLIIRGGHNIDPRTIEEALLRHPGVRGAVAVGRPDRHSGEVPVAYIVPADPGTFDESELLAWAGTAIGEAAARPKNIYPIDAIPVTEVGKHFKPALIADAAARAITDALAAADLTDARATAAYEDGRLVVTVTGADPGRVRDAVAGFALTIRTGPSPAAQTATK